MQRKGCGCVGAETVIALLCLGQNHNFAQYSYKQEKNLGDA